MRAQPEGGGDERLRRQNFRADARGVGWQHRYFETTGRRSAQRGDGVAKRSVAARRQSRRVRLGECPLGAEANKWTKNWSRTTSFWATSARSSVLCWCRRRRCCTPRPDSIRAIGEGRGGCGRRPVGVAQVSRRQDSTSDWQACGLARRESSVIRQAARGCAHRTSHSTVADTKTMPAKSSQMPCRIISGSRMWPVP